MTKILNLEMKKVCAVITAPKTLFGIKVKKDVIAMVILNGWEKNVN